MKARMQLHQVAPELMQGMLALEKLVMEGGLESSLYELVKARASQINGCAFCIHMHTKDAMGKGESPERLLLLDAWRESPLYSERERAALEWTEALTLVAQTHAPDMAYEQLQPHFTPKEIATLTMLIVAINGWNRIAIGFRYVHPVRAGHAAG